MRTCLRKHIQLFTSLICSCSSNIVTPRPDEVHSTCNCNGAYAPSAIVKFSKNCATFVIKESGGVKI